MANEKFTPGPWHEVKNARKDMPHNREQIIYRTDLGWNFTGWYNPHTRKLYRYSVRKGGGKVDGVEERLAGVVAWIEMPPDNPDWI